MADRRHRAMGPSERSHRLATAGNARRRPSRIRPPSARRHFKSGDGDTRFNEVPAKPGGTRIPRIREQPRKSTDEIDRSARLRVLR
jgi:hypothetical protein